jgi:hypothetical protein
MKALLSKAIVLACLAVSIDIAHAEGCTGTRSGIGAMIGGALGTLLFPGLGTVGGAALLGGGVCGYDWLKRRLGADGSTTTPAVASSEQR